MSGRSRSLATTLFFETQLLGMDEVPHRSVVDLKAPLGKLADQPAQREVSFLDPAKKPSPVRPRNRLRLAPAHLAGRTAPRPPRPTTPSDRRAGTYPNPRGCLSRGQPTRLNRRNHAFT